MWPGNTTDVTTLIPVVDRLKRRFGIVRVCVVVSAHLKTRDSGQEPTGRGPETASARA
jgi:hypothetical protein